MARGSHSARKNSDRWGLSWVLWPYRQWWFYFMGGLFFLGFWIGDEERPLVPLLIIAGLLAIAGLMRLDRRR